MERDPESSQFYDHARSHEVQIRRFLSPDVVIGQPHDPQSWNRYAYVTNNPLKYVDPDGKDKVAEFFLGPEGKGLSTWDVIFSRDTLNEVSRGRDEFLEEHRELTHGFSPVPTTTGEAGVALVLAMVSGPASGPIRTTLTEAKALVGAWARGSFNTVSKSLTYHFARHGEEVGAKTMLTYLRKAADFARTAEKGATKTILGNGMTRYEKAGRYVIKDANGNIISFGAI
jgi:RHS repeat-associated protein